MWQTFPNADQQAAAVAAQVSDWLRQALRAKSRALLAVSGGRSPIPVFERLAQTELDWGRVDLTLVDERFVAPDDPDSNERLLRRHLLQQKAAAASFHGLVQAGCSLAECVQLANQRARPADVVLLGMGEDGHTASLFPDAPELAPGLDPSNPDAYLPVHPGRAPHARISMTLAELLRAEHRLLCISGTAKRAVLRNAAAGAELPIAHLLRHSKRELEIYDAA